ncbi:MAG: 4-(cytidine 5'-diphospho)-2-C-methyl-D-erythritol kinase [Clostridiales bacterium]|jgi:4-diphosphocytidyl-2-C-methyl-D-erythritol kinase|nr:4-(cytidine 5'-diphospho)-2-C-methyl-D-erythritol kinase [Clostridiales bacterium]
MESVKIFARAKINTALDILGRRADGYHEIRTVMQQLLLSDELLLQKTNEAGNNTFTFRCADPALPADGSNLVCKASRYLIETYHITQPFTVSLIKNIPVSAGLAGGSSDCAAALMGINTLFDLKIPRSQLLEIGKGFGADVPFCLTGGPALAEGIGEILTPLPPHPEVFIVLARLPAEVSTREIFRLYDRSDNTCHPDIGAMTDACYAGDAGRIARCFGNALQSVTAGMHPEILPLIKTMRDFGAMNASMTGSGPTVFGYFHTKEDAEYCMAEIKRKNPPVRDVILTGVYNNP